MPLPDRFLQSLPSHSKLETIVYVETGSSGAANPSSKAGGLNLYNSVPLPPALGKIAVVCESSSSRAAVSDESLPNELSLLCIPAENFSDEQGLSLVRDWVEQANDGESNWNGQQSLMLNLQHVQVYWSPQRIAIIAEETQIDTVRRAVVEVNYFIRELKSIEQALTNKWQQLEDDTALAFEFTEQKRHQQSQLRQRFQETLSLRARLARVTPFLLAPHVYPPKLASQVGERLRERIRVHEQVEFVSDQLEVFENVYGMCGQRTSDFEQARRGHTLEWIIIVLLAAEVILMSFEYLAAAGGN